MLNLVIMERPVKTRPVYHFVFAELAEIQVYLFHRVVSPVRKLALHTSLVGVFIRRVALWRIIWLCPAGL